MYQLKNLLNLTGISADPSKNMKVSEDFLLLLQNAHIVAAAKTILDLNPSASKSLSYIARSIINNYLLLPGSKDNKGSNQDGVHLYACELLTLSLLWHSFHDAIREGDGERILLSWKIFIHVFKATRHYKEAVNFLFQYNTLSPRLAAQLLWSRCINTKGRIGTNVPCDLHLEHLNRRVKVMLQSLGSNIKPSSILRAGKSLAAVHNM